MLLFIWGRIAGWSEVAVRALPFLAGLLAHAVVYRAGRDLFSPQAGLFAILLFAASMFPQTNMLHARAFPLVLLFTSLCLWSWWRVTLRPQPPGRRAQAGLLLGATGLLFSHYLASLLLPVLGLFHLFFAPRKRHWWRPVLLVGLAILIALLQTPFFLQALAFTAAKTSLSRQGLVSPGTTGAIHSVTSSTGLVAPSSPVGELLVILLPLGLVTATLLHLRARRKADAVWFLTFVTATLLLLFTATNEMLRVVTERRMRYLMALWPPIALLAGAGLHRVAGGQRLLAAALLAFWLILGTWLGLATNYRYELGFFELSQMHLAYRAAGEHIPVTDAWSWTTRWMNSTGRDSMSGC